MLPGSAPYDVAATNDEIDPVAAASHAARIGVNNSVSIRFSKETRVTTAIAVGVCVLFGVVMGCTGVSREVLDEISKTSEEFLLGPEDVVEVTVWWNPDLTREVIVRPDGMISLPLIGDVQASGLVAEQLAREIAERLKAFMESPSVSVSVRTVNSYSVYVLGEVPNPGKFQLKSYATVLQVIALAGGFTQFASRNNIQVIRNSANGDPLKREMHIPVRYNDLLSGEGATGNFILKSGDVIVVP